RTAPTTARSAPSLPGTHLDASADGAARTRHPDRRPSPTSAVSSISSGQGGYAAIFAAARDFFSVALMRPARLCGGHGAALMNGQISAQLDRRLRRCMCLTRRQWLLEPTGVCGRPARGDGQAYPPKRADGAAELGSAGVLGGDAALSPRQRRLWRELRSLRRCVPSGDGGLSRHPPRGKPFPPSVLGGVHLSPRLGGA